MQVLKWVGIGLGGLVGVVVLALVVLFFIGGSRLNKTYDVPAEAVTVPTDAASIERGLHLVESAGLCMECHGDNLAGEILEDDPVFARLVSSNLTSGQSGIGVTYSDADFVRAIRHGVGPNNEALIIMPSDSFNKFSVSDLGAIIAYLKTLPTVDNELPDTDIGPAGRIFLGLGLIPQSDFLPATAIDHAAPLPSVPELGVTAEYGQYLVSVSSCTFCHGEDLSGADSPGAGPSPNLTPGGPLQG